LIAAAGLLAAATLFRRRPQPRAVVHEEEGEPTMTTKTYEVLRDHGTSPSFKKGDTRELMDHEAAPLVQGGTLRLAGGGEDLVDAAKAERAAPLNKAEPVPDFNKTKPRVPRE
jgi:hypothetical protein